MHLARVLALCVLACAGCAHLPNSTMQYYLPRTDVSFTVQRAVICDAKDNVIVTDTVTPVVTHSADTSSPHTIGYAGLNSVFADSDVKFDFYDDGRLRGINATLTGEGESILKTAISIAGSIATAQKAPFSRPSPCEFIKSVATDKPLVLSYNGTVNLEPAHDGQPSRIVPDASSAIYARALSSVIGPICARVLSRKAPGPLMVNTQVDGVLLKARQPGLLEIAVSRGEKGRASCERHELWRQKVAVAQAGTEYDLPVPKAPAFGKQTFVAAFAESGALTSLQYVSNTGAGQALNVVQSGVDTAQGIAAKRATEVNAEADLIKAQQRLAQCRADPKSCN